MEPTLFEGDWLLVDPRAFAAVPPSVGDLVVARDPRSHGRLLVKRVAGVTPGGVLVSGDHPAHATDAAAIGAVTADLLVGRPWLRYWPPRRIGRIRRRTYRCA